MKREFIQDKLEEQDNNTNMFSKPHHQTHNTKFQHLSPTPHLHPSAAEEADSHSPAHRRNDDTTLAFPLRQPIHDGATIEVVRRPRGRPPGSKNKPKPPVVIHRDAAEPAMSPYVLELPPGVDIVDATTSFCRKRNMGLCILNGNGAVSNVTLKQPSTTPGATVTFHGRFDILSISATILPPGGDGGAAAGNGPFALTLAGPQGQVVGGHVVGQLLSAATIYLIAANFSNPTYHRLQPSENEQDDPGRDGGVPDSPTTASGGGGGAPLPSGGASMFSYQSSDVIWAPATRPPQPPPPY